MRKIRNHRKLLEKARTHRVIEMQEGKYMSRYKVRSGSSGDAHWVEFKEKFGVASCSCNWGTQGGFTRLDASACSHVLRVVMGREARDGRRIVTWSEMEDALRQHRPVLDLGNGVVATSRLATT